MKLTKKRWRFMISGIFLILVFSFFVPKFLGSASAVTSTPPFPTPTIGSPTLVRTPVTTPATTQAAGVLENQKINCTDQCKTTGDLYKYFENAGVLRPLLCPVFCWGINVIVDAMTNIQYFIISFTHTTLGTEIKQAGLSNVWKFTLSLVNYVVVAFLIFIAFVNILRINVDVYAVKKALPNLIIGVILANLSWLICMEFVTLADILTAWINNLSDGITRTATHSIFLNSYLTLWRPLIQPYSAGVAGDFSIATLVNAFYVGINAVSNSVFWLVSLPFLILIPLILALIIGFLLIIREYVVMFLIIAAPLAFIAMSLPLTQKMFQQWWGQFMKWVFLAPVAYLLWLVGMAIANGLSSPNYLLTYGLMTAAFYFSITLPFQLGGAVMAKWGTAGKTMARGAGAKFGDWTAKKGWGNLNPFGLAQGVQNYYKKRGEESINQSAELGREKTEGITNIPGQALKKIQNWENRGEIPWMHTPTTGGAAEDAMMKPIMDKAKNFARYSTPDEINLAFAQSLKDKNKGEYDMYAAAKIMQGTMSDDDLHNFLGVADGKYRKSKGGEEEIDQHYHNLINRAVGTNQTLAGAGRLPAGGSVMVNPFQRIGRIFKKMKPEEFIEKQAEAFSHLYNNKNTSSRAIASAASILTAGAANNKTDSPQFQGAQRFLSGVYSNSAAWQNIQSNASPNTLQAMNKLVQDKIITASARVAPQAEVSLEEMRVGFSKNALSGALAGLNINEDIKKALEESIDQNKAINLPDIRTRIQGKVTPENDIEIVKALSNISQDVEQKLKDLDTGSLNENLSNLKGLDQNVEAHRKTIINVHDNLEVLKGGMQENLRQQMDKILPQFNNKEAIKKMIEAKFAQDPGKVDVKNEIMTNIQTSLKAGNVKIDAKALENTLNKYKTNREALDKFKAKFGPQIEDIRKKIKPLEP